MNNLVTDLSVLQQISEAGVLGHLVFAIVSIVGVVIFLTAMYRLYKDLDKRIDERIDARLKPSLHILQETVTVVKGLEHTVAEMNATLNILKEILLNHENH